MKKSHGIATREELQRLSLEELFKFSESDNGFYFTLETPDITLKFKRISDNPKSRNYQRYIAHRANDSKNRSYDEESLVSIARNGQLDTQGLIFYLKNPFQIEAHPMDLEATQDFHELMGEVEGEMLSEVYRKKKHKS
jgi:hypothetical protein